MNDGLSSLEMKERADRLLKEETLAKDRRQGPSRPQRRTA